MEMLEEGFISIEIANKLNLNKSLVSYYVGKGRRLGYIKKTVRNKLELTEAGKNFVEWYEKQDQTLPVCRAENIRFKALVMKKPVIPPNWQKVQMHNWAAHTSEVDSVKIKLNMGTRPTIEFIPSPVEGDNPFHLYAILFYECSKAAQTLHDTLGLEVGRLELSSRGEWLTYDPIAREFCKKNGQVKYEGIGTVNASRPRSIGEFEFHDPRALADYMLMPRRVEKIETMIQKIETTIQKLLEDIRHIKGE